MERGAGVGVVGSVGARVAPRQSVRAASFSFDTHEASGERAAPFGRINSALESNAFPRRSLLAQIRSSADISLLRNDVSSPVGGMMRISPSAVRSTRKFG